MGKKSRQQEDYEVSQEQSYEESQEESQEGSQEESQEESQEGLEDGSIEDSEEDKRISKEEMMKITKRLKTKIVEWMDYDDKIKSINEKAKKYKDAKKSHEEFILKLISSLGIEEQKIDVTDKNKQIRGRVYRQKSITKGAIKEDVIKAALIEAIPNEKKVLELLKKIDNRRPVTERYYLKCTKGSK